MAKPSNVLLMRVSVDGVAKAHGEKSVAVDEANKLLSAAIGRLLAASQKSSDSVLFVQTTEKDVAASRKNIYPPKPYSLRRSRKFRPTKMTPKARKLLLR